MFAGGTPPAGARRPSSAADGDGVLTTDGPYAEGKEFIGGFDLIQAEDLDGALAWAGKLARILGGLPVEVRPVRRSRLLTAEIERVFREHYGRAVAVLVRAPRRHRRRRGGGAGRLPHRRAAVAGDGVPPSPAGWIITTARNRAIDRLRREASRADRHAQAALLPADAEPEEEGPVQDDRLRLIFTCCHPALATAAQVALTLRLLGGLTTAEIARGVPRARADDGAAAGAGEGQDPRRRHPVPGADGGRAARPAARRPGRRLPDLQRGAHGVARASGWSARTSAPRRSGSAGCWRS